MNNLQKFGLGAFFVSALPGAVIGAKISGIPGAKELAVPMSKAFCKLGSDEFCNYNKKLLEGAMKVAPKIK